MKNEKIRFYKEQFLDGKEMVSQIIEKLDRRYNNDRTRFIHQLKDNADELGKLLGLPKAQFEFWLARAYPCVSINDTEHAEIKEKMDALLIANRNEWEEKSPYYSSTKR